MLHTFVGKVHSQEISAGSQQCSQTDASTRESDQNIHIFRDIAPGVCLHNLLDGSTRIKFLCSRHCNRDRVLPYVAATGSVCSRVCLRNPVIALYVPQAHSLVESMKLRNMMY